MDSVHRSTLTDVWMSVGYSEKSTKTITDAARCSGEKTCSRSAALRASHSALSFSVSATRGQHVSFSARKRSIRPPALALGSSRARVAGGGVASP